MNEYPAAIAVPSASLVSAATPALIVFAGFAFFTAAIVRAIAFLRGAEGEQLERATAHGFLGGGLLGVVVLATSAIAGS